MINNDDDVSAIGRPCAELYPAVPIHIC